jgi:phosphoglycolate phosphatase-like HAD superfamily hydrolase
VLLLFDIDGTLVRGAAREHAHALLEALHEVHHVVPERGRSRIEPAGRTDGDIARAYLLDAGVSAERIDELAGEVAEVTARNYAAMELDLSGTVVDGIPSLLDWLRGRPGVTLGLLTGNFQPVARLKLTRAGLADYFAGCPGAYGSDHEDRAALPAIARRRAGSVGHPCPREQTVVIGDTPRDIACARADDLRCVAVATGPYSVDQLRDADVAVPDARALRRALAELLVAGPT